MQQNDTLKEADPTKLKKLFILRPKIRQPAQNFDFLPQNDLEVQPMPKIKNDDEPLQTITEVELIECSYCQIRHPKNESFKKHEEECYAKYSEQTACKQCNTMVLSQFIEDHLVNCTKVIEMQQKHQLKKEQIQDNDQDSTCTICAESYDGIQTKQYLPCCHAYHQVCIQAWLKKKKICPQCRLEVREYESNDVENPRQQSQEQIPRGFQILRLPSFLDDSDNDGESLHHLNILTQIRRDLLRIHGLHQIFAISTSSIQNLSSSSEQEEDIE